MERKEDKKTLEKALLKGKPSRYFAAVGASAGGPKALVTVLSALSEDTCAILVVQHLSKGFSRQFVRYLSPFCRMRVKEAEAGETVCDGTIYVAADGEHLKIAGRSGGYRIVSAPGPKVMGVCPSIDCLMESAARAGGDHAMGVILTGMGRDGAVGLLKMRQAGAYTIAQDQRTSEIYGMPGEAVRCGGAVKEVPLCEVAGEIQNFCIRMNKRL